MLSKRIIRLFSNEHMKNIRFMGVQNKNIVFNPTVSELYEIAFLKEKPSDVHTKQTFVSNDGALCADSGLMKSRNQKQERVVKDAETQKTVLWQGSKNIPLKKESFRLVEQFAIDYINHKNRCLVVDGYIGWNPASRLKVRTFCTRSYHALFMHNLLVRPTEKELQEDFTKGVDVHVFNAGQMAVSKHIEGIGSNSITALNLNEKKLAILGTQFAGEMKKALFKIIHYILPRKGSLTMRASATVGPDGRVVVICGRSATGKSALFMDNDRKVISDDELVWSDEGVSGVEGGCYVKIHAHDAKENTPVDNAIKYGTLLENVNFYPESREVNYSDSSSTHNLRAVFPLNYLSNAAIPPMGGHPEHFVLLSCDQTGVLPLVSKLTPEQAAYYFLSGYTTKLSDPKNPEPTFSACFGETSLPLSPSVYAKLFYEKIKKHGTKVWLINSGWTKNKSGMKRIISFDEIETVIDAIIANKLNDAETKPIPHFNLQVPNAIEGVADELLHPGWDSKIEYNEELSTLAIKFTENFDQRHKGKLGSIEDAVSEAKPQV